MVRPKLALAALLFILPVSGIEIAAQTSSATIKDSALWEMDLKTLGYPACPSESSSKNPGAPPTTLAFAGPLHLVATFISCGRLYATVFDASVGRVEVKRDWASGNRSDGAVTAHN